VDWIWRSPTKTCVDHNAVLVPHVLGERRGVDAIDAHHCQAPRLTRFEARENLHARMALNRIGPTEGQIAQPSGFALAADRLVKRQCFADGCTNGQRVSANLL